MYKRQYALLAPYNAIQRTGMHKGRPCVVVGYYDGGWLAVKVLAAQKKGGPLKPMVVRLHPNAVERVSSNE